MFIHDADIPKDFAIAVWEVLHNKAVYETWEIIDSYSDQPRLDWVSRIFCSNGSEWNEQEEEWWKQQLKETHNG